MWAQGSRRVAAEEKEAGIWLCWISPRCAVCQVREVTHGGGWVWYRGVNEGSKAVCVCVCACSIFLLPIMVYLIERLSVLRYHPCWIKSQKRKNLDPLILRRFSLFLRVKSCPRRTEGYVWKCSCSPEHRLKGNKINEKVDTQQQRSMCLFFLVTLSWTKWDYGFCKHVNPAHSKGERSERSC